MSITKNPIPRTLQALPLSMPNLLLRAEGVALLGATLWLYGHLGYGWLAFGLFLLTPDLTFLLYRLNKDIGSVAYNLAHFQGAPALLTLIGLLAAAPLAIQIGLIWFAHIAMDRAVGYGFKYMGQFKDTHLQHI